MLVLIYLWGIAIGYFWGRNTAPERVVFLNCNHGFENPEDCRRYVEGDKK